MKLNDAVVALGALAQVTRLEIFRLLVPAGEQGLFVGQIAEKLQARPNATLAFHLKELVNSGLASARSKGRFVYYSANYPTMNALLAYLTENCCAGHDCGTPLTPCDPKSFTATSFRD